MKDYVGEMWDDILPHIQDELRMEKAMRYECLVAEREEEREEARFAAWTANYRIEMRDTTSRYSRVYSTGWYVQERNASGQWNDILCPDGRGYLCSESESGARCIIREEYGIEDALVIEQVVPERIYGPMVGGNATWGRNRI